MGRTRTVVKNRYHRPGSGRTAPRAHRGKAGLGARRSIGNALRYIQTRLLGQDEAAADRAIFDRARDDVSRAEARERLAERALGHVAYHSMVLSPGSGSEDMSTAELRAWTRRVMADLEARLGRELVWYAVLHRHTAHPHMHVIVGASTRDGRGRAHAVRFNRDDFAAMRESGDRWHDAIWSDHWLQRLAGAYALAAAREAAAVLARSGTGGGAAANDRDRIEQDEWERQRER